jgi:thiol-disulfide isomerase/thioredoxin
MDDKLLKNIPYLEEADLTEEGHLQPSLMKALGNKPVLLMVQGNFCGWCTIAKPEFQKLCDQPDFKCLTIQIDDGKSGDKAAQKVNKVHASRGVPTFLIFGKDGKFSNAHDGERKADSLLESIRGKK